LLVFAPRQGLGHEGRQMKGALAHGAFQGYELEFPADALQLETYGDHPAIARRIERHVVPAKPKGFAYPKPQSEGCGEDDVVPVVYERVEQQPDVVPREMNRSFLGHRTA
jgi:hypothetical protein